MSDSKNTHLFAIIDALSHDLKSPLASILSMISLIKLRGNRVSAEELQEYLLRAEEKAQFLNENIDALFASGALLENALKLENQTLDLLPLLERFQFSLKGFEFPTLEDAVHVVGDEEWLPKALITILQHVSRLQDEQSAATITVKTINQNVILEIQYRGTPLPMKHFKLQEFLPHVGKTIRLSLFVAIQILQQLGGDFATKSADRTQTWTVRILTVV